MMPRTTQAIALFATAALLGGCDLAAQGSSVYGSFDRTVAVPPRATLIVTNGSGDIRVTPGPTGSIHVMGKIRARDSIFADLSASQRVARLESNPPIVQEGTTVRLGDTGDAALRDVKIDYEITVPPDTAVTTRSGSGDQWIGAVSGRVDIRAGSGDISVGPAGADVSVRTGSGDITVSGASGTVHLTTGSGDVEGRDLRGGVDIHTASGDINLDGQPTADWSAAAASGDVMVRFPSNASFTLDATTSSGSIRTSHAIVADSDQSRRRLAGPAGGGGPRVKLSTASGSINLQ
jgi:Toastrack DUF4097